MSGNAEWDAGYHYMPPEEKERYWTVRVPESRFLISKELLRDSTVDALVEMVLPVMKKQLVRRIEYVKRTKECP